MSRLKIVEEEPGRQLRSHLYAWLAILITLVASAAAGWRVGAGQLEQVRQEAAEMREQLGALQSERATLMTEVARLERLHEVDQVALDELRQSLEALESERRQMQQDIAFYKGIMAPSDGKTGLAIQKFELRKGESPRHWRYKFVLTQLGNNGKRISGQVTLSVVGEQNGETRILSLRDLAGAEKLGMPFRFRYFQEFTGELTLPEAFEPGQIQIVAQGRGKRATKIEKAYDWPKEH
ncbi:DUF6776 family protein [Hahella sp. SMD15-11]|uniref:DUF6776 family protein n=1 Tax=Thermohahella caldifontis TaxID=3142973 RepID=A0AB39UUS9_9GAMM